MKTTGFSRVSKDLIIKELEKEIKPGPTMFVAEHGSLSATALDKLRKQLRGSNSRYFVVKNSLGRIALEKANLKPLADAIKGGSGIAFSGGDVVQSSKILVDFSKENAEFKIQQAVMNGSVLTLDQIKHLASLPSREVLLARVLGGMMAPVQNFVGVLSGTIRQIVTVLDAVAKKKK